MQSIITFKKIRGFCKKTAIAVFLLTLFTGLANAQTFVNGNLSTGATLSTGTAAPAGFTWSELQTGNNSLGYAASITAGAGFTVADNFTVPAGPSWTISKATFFAYSTGFAGATSPFNDVRVLIYNTNPSVGSPAPIFGDLTTNRFLASSTASMYRTAVPAGTTRQIWKIEANINTTLAPGSYWIEWQVGNGGLSNFSPPSTVVGTTTQAGNNAIQRTLPSTWAALTDVGGPQDMPFILNYTTGPCAGTPAPGNTVTSSATVCPATPFNLSVQNATSGSGVTYQWFSGASATGPWTAITGATSSTYTVASLAATTFYQATVTCSGNTGTSTPVQVTLNLPSACYCIPAASDCTDDDVIENVKLDILNNTSTCSASGYNNFTALTDTANVIQGALNPISVRTGDSWTEQVGVWIDYDKSGSFEASEFTNLGSTAAGSGGLHNGSINVPATAPLGVTRMRVRVRFSTALTGTNACLAYAFGETEDYTVRIVPCTPVTVTTQPVSVSAVCGNTATFTAALAGSIPSGYWQFRTTATGIWNPVLNAAPYSGITTPTLTINPVTVALNGYQYRFVYQGACTGANFSNAATLTATALVTTVTPTSASVCKDAIQQLSITNTLGNTTIWTENFDVAIPLPTGWAQKNNSSPLGPNGWLQGNAANFPAYNGAGTSYITALWSSTTTTGAGDISNWLFTPVTSLKNGDQIKFFTRTTTPGTTEFPDRLEVRLSTAGTSTEVGATAASTGDFGNLLLSINPTLITNVYPKDWAEFTATVSGVTGTVSGRFAFRYFVTNGGGAGANSDAIGIDNVRYIRAGGPAEGTWAGRAGTIFTDAAATTPYTGTATTSVYVKPDTTGVLNYTVSFATAACQSTVATIPVTVRQLPTSVSAVANKVICQNGNTSFSVNTFAGGANYAMQWQVSTDAGTTYTNVTNGPVYSGATTNTLTLTGVPQSYNANRYRLVVSATPCTGTVTSAAGILTVNATPVVTLATTLTEIYPGQVATITASVSPNAGSAYTWFRDGVVVAGATARTLAVDVDGLGSYKVTVTDVNGCIGTSGSVTIKEAANDILFIYPSPNTGQFQVRYYSELGSTQFPRTVNVYDNKGTRVFTKAYSINSPYTRIDVDLKNHAKGLYSVELTDYNGNRIKTGRVLVL